MRKQVKLAGAVGLGSVVLGILFNAMFLEQAIGISLFIFTSIYILLIQLIKYIRAGKLVYNYWQALYFPLLLVSLVPFLSQSGVTTLWSVFITFLGVIWLTIHDLWQLKDFNFLQAIVVGGVTTTLQPFYWLIPTTKLAKGINQTSLKPSGRLLKAAAAIIIAMPLLFITVTILSSADPIFSKLISSTAQFPSISFNWVTFLIIAGYFFTLLCVALFFEFTPIPSHAKPTLEKIDPLIAIVVVNSLNLALAIFVAVQVIYLFGGHSQLQNLGVSYAEYARSGFFDLVKIGFITASVVYLFGKYSKFNLANRLSQAVLLILSIVTLYSAYFRLQLYIQAYSLSTIRVMVLAVMLFILLVLGFLLLTRVKAGLLSYFSAAVFVSCCFVVTLFGVINPDRLIAQTNIQNYLNQTTLNKEIDIYYLISLSADAYYHVAKMPGLEKKYMCKIAISWSIDSKFRNSFWSTSLPRVFYASELNKYLEDYLWVDQNGNREPVNDCYHYSLL